MQDESPMRFNMDDEENRPCRRQATPRQYARAHAEDFRRDLHELLRIPGLSGDPAYAAEVRLAAEWLATHLRELGAEHVQVMPTGGHPVVYGDWLGAGPDKPTVLVYGHYDMVPAAKEDGWDTPPFEPVEKNGRIYARGAPAEGWR
jgi:acetylornithine deacetylase/succinyl-diaminopimelate desuccinylase-like protein